MTDLDDARAAAFERQPLDSLPTAAGVTVDHDGVPDAVVDMPAAHVIEMFAQRMVADLLSCSSKLEAVATLQHWYHLCGHDSNFIPAVAVNALVDLTVGNPLFTAEYRAEATRAAQALWEQGI